MTPQAIEAIARSVPDAMDRRRPDPTWPTDVVIVDQGTQDAEELEEGLFPPDPQGLGGSGVDGSLPSDTTAPQPDLFEDGELLAPEAPIAAGTIEDVGGVIQRIQDALGNGWPGAPGGSTVRGRFPDTEAFAFYLPWHRFSTAIWGIYLTVDGIEALGRLIHSAAREGLTGTEAKRAAKLFMFHHEAYHNAVETYAARIEVSHRQACYRIGVVGTYTTLLPETGLHEEGLANAYAYEKVRTGFLSDIEMSAAQRRIRQRAAAQALRLIISGMSPTYASALRVIDGQVDFDDAQFELMESCHRLSGLHVPRASADLWLAFPYAMAPSLARNKSFSYVIDRTHPAIRQAVEVPRFHRIEVIRRLREATGAWEEGGGKHPKIVLPSGRRIPVPAHTDLARGTVRSILRAAGVDMPLEKFMSAKVYSRSPSH